MDEALQIFILLWAVIDPIGTVPVFIAVTARHQPEEMPKIAIRAVGIAAIILLFFIVAGQFLLDTMQVPLSAFQIAGGLVLFMFGFSMVFGESKPVEELRILRSSTETAIFPLAVPSIAGPGAMMAVVLLTDSHRFDLPHQLKTTAILAAILLIQLALLLSAKWIHKMIGTSGADVISRIMGLILTSIGVNSVLSGIRGFFGF